MPGYVHWRTQGLLCSRSRRVWGTVPQLDRRQPLVGRAVFEAGVSFVTSLRTHQEGSIQNLSRCEKCAARPPDCSDIKHFHVFRACARTVIYPVLEQAVDDGSALIIVNSQSQQLFAVDPDTGVATEIDLGGELLPGSGGDGLVRQRIVDSPVVVDAAPVLLLKVVGWMCRCCCCCCKSNCCCRADTM